MKFFNKHKRPIIGIPARSGAIIDVPACGVIEWYTWMVTLAGGEPLIIPLEHSSCLPRIFDLVDGILLTGGEDINPNRYQVLKGKHTGATNYRRDSLEFKLLEHSLARGIPVLGICRGFQVISVFSGAKLEQHLDPQTGHHSDSRTPRWTEIAHHLHLEKSPFRSLVGRDLEMNSVHHQGVCDFGYNQLNLSIISRVHNIIEIAVNERAGIVAIQGHPEALIAARSSGNCSPMINSAGKKCELIIAEWVRRCQKS